MMDGAGPAGAARAAAAPRTLAIRDRQLVVKGQSSLSGRTSAGGGRILSALLRADKNAEIVRLPLSLISLFMGRRYTLASGRRTFDVRWSKAARDALLAEQLHDPVLLHRDGARGYWMFQDCIYWEGEDLTAEDVKALALQRTRKRERQLATAHSLMRAEQEGQFVRMPVPVDVRRAVFERDGGRCVECGGNFDLQYDHVLPVSLGGATAVANLQLLCGDCNRRKGANL